jgi:hypothetical protein
MTQSGGLIEMRGEGEIGYSETRSLAQRGGPQLKSSEKKDDSVVWCGLKSGKLWRSARQH